MHAMMSPQPPRTPALRRRSRRANPGDGNPERHPPILSATAGEHYAANDALTHAQRMIAQGADIIDVGGESTRPGAVRIRC